MIMVTVIMITVIMMIIIWAFRCLSALMIISKIRANECLYKRVLGVLVR